MQKTSKSENKKSSNDATEPKKGARSVELAEKQPKKAEEVNEVTKTDKNETTKKTKTAKKVKSEGKLSVGTIIIIVLACVTVLALVIMACLAMTSGLGSSETSQISISGEESSGWQREGQILKTTGEITTTCEIVNRNLDSDLRPMGGEKANESNLGAGKYGAYSSLECVAKVEGSYDELKKGAKLTVTTNEGDFELEERGDKFELKHTYRIFADLTGAPRATPYKVVLQVKSKNGKVLSEYDLSIKVALSNEDKGFVADWKAKIDEQIAQKEREEKEKAEREAAQRESELNNAITPDYTDLFRNWRSYQGKYIRITGRIVQTNSSNSFCRVATEVYNKSASSYAAKYRYSGDDVIYVSPCNPGTKLLEDDVISVVGEASGNYTYETVMGGSIEIPRIKGIRFWLLDHVK